MPIINYEAANFTGSFANLNVGGFLNVSWPQIVWAAVTTGKAVGDEYAYGLYSTFERIHRASMIYAYLLEGNNGNLLRSAAFAAADPSEKGGISYSFGMTLAKLFAEALFSTPRLLHYAVYAQNYQIATMTGNSRPDLIGITSTGDWIVFEAKGRSNGIDSDALETAKQQAEQVLTIDGIAPICRIGSLSYFSATGMRFAMDDPEPTSEGHSRRIRISKEQVVATYDSSLRRLIESRGAPREVQADGLVYKEVRIDEADISLGLPEAPSVIRRPLQLSPTTYIGADGLLVSLGESWSDERMHREPHLR